MSEIEPNEVVIQFQGDPRAHVAWQPVVREETEDLIRHFSSKLDADGKQKLLDSTSTIIGHCIDPTNTEPSINTGLVVGYVQSGKTMSFTTLAAMAADNGFPLIIVITGTTELLFEQSAQRLDKDLRLDSRGDRKWQHIREPGVSERARVGDILDDWRDPGIPQEERQIALITLKKNWSVLRRLVELLRTLNCGDIPALIIDDEADQASLNTLVRRQEESTTYARLGQLRAIFPRHTFIQYTATPQANLLISILDSLSPDFSELLLPGEDYTGGIEFFSGSRDRICDILPSEVPTRRNPVVEPPDSLIKALLLYFIGVAAGFALSQTVRNNRTMLVHPSRETVPHLDYAGWTRALIQGWKDILALSDSDPDKMELLDEFHRAYEEIKHTVGAEMPAWELLKPKLYTSVRRTRIEVVNRTDDALREVPWRDCYSWILVGGQKLDRGFTVEGLTVTYMPRGVGMGNADTLQQRARFFGYKRQYLGYCRVFLEAGSVDAFTDYVIHEENMRQQLEGFRRTGLPLNQWKRAFLMPTGLQPTRRNVLSNDHTRGEFADSWFWVRSPHLTDDAIVANRNLFDTVVTDHVLKSLSSDLFGDPATRHHGALDLPLKEVFETLLVNYKVPDEFDGQRHYGALLQIQNYLSRNPDEVCDMFFMNPDEGSERAVNAGSSQIANIFQGSNRSPGDPQYYPGDRAIRREENLSVQLRRLRLTEHGSEIMADVPVLAIWVPDKMGQEWLVQDV